MANTPKLGPSFPMTQSDTMITVHKKLYQDIFHNRDWPLFSASQLAASATDVPRVTLVEFSVFEPGIPREVELMDKACAEHVSGLIFTNVNKDAGIEPWLFVADRWWRHKSERVMSDAFRSLPKEWMLERMPRSVEIAVEQDGRVRFAAISKLDRETFSFATALLRRHLASYILLSSRPEVATGESLKSMYLSAFPKQHSEECSEVNWPSLAADLCPKGDIIVRVSGSYDERLVAIDCLVPDDLVSVL
jgi:hypothetical protein